MNRTHLRHFPPFAVWLAAITCEDPGWLELARSSLDPARAEIHLGWKAWTTLPEGTAEVLRWFASSTPLAKER